MAPLSLTFLLSPITTASSSSSTTTTASSSAVPRKCPSAASPARVSACRSSASTCSAASSSACSASVSTAVRSLCAWLCCSRCCDDAGADGGGELGGTAHSGASGGWGRRRRPTNRAKYEMANSAWDKVDNNSTVGDGLKHQHSPVKFNKDNSNAAGAILSEAQCRKQSPGGVSSMIRRKVSPTTMATNVPHSARAATGAQKGGSGSPVLRNVSTPSMAFTAAEVCHKSSDGKRSLGALETLHKFAHDYLCPAAGVTAISRRAKFRKHLLGDDEGGGGQRKWRSLEGATERAERSLPMSGRPCSQLSVRQQQQLLLLRDLSPDQPPPTLCRISPIPEDGAGTPGSHQSGFNEILNMAVSNPDLVQFQLVLNDWFRRQCKLRTSAFLLNSAELNMTLCQVCGTELSNEEGPIQCGDAEYLDNLFDECAAVAGTSASSSDGISPRAQQRTTGGSTVSYYAPVVAKLDKLSEKHVQPIRPVLARLCRSFSGTNGDDGTDGTLAASPTISLVGIKANCGFTAILLAVHQSEDSREEELQLMRPHLDMMANLLSIFHNIEEQRRLAHQMQLFLCMTQNVFSSLQDMNLLVRNITKEAKALVHAEICSLFLLDKEHSELVAEVFEKNGTTDEYLTEIRMPLNQGIVGHVASTGQMMNVHDVYSHPNFYPKVDERTGFITRNILCFPIKDSSGNLVGVAELCNKIGRDSFTRHDEQIAATFAVYCAISISHCLLYRKLLEAHRRSHITAELLVQSSTLSIAPEDILRLTVRDIPSPDSFHPEFNQFHFVPRSIGGGEIYVEASLSMFKSLGFIDRYRIRRRTLARFLLMVQKGYRDVPYHNWSHAFAVAHFCFLLLRMPAVKSVMHELDRFALLVACLCHDIDHRGTTNAFQLQSKTPLAQLYSSEGSVLERHHFAQTVSILGMDECNIFDQLNQQQYQQIMDCIREVILATDIAAHLRKVERIAEMANVGFDSRSDEHRYLFTCLLMTASDLSDQSKDFRHSKAIAENIYKEFFSQGDLEKEMGNRPIEMMDRERACVPKIQIEFMDTVALPVFSLLGQLLPDLKPTHQALLHNRSCWLMLDHILQQQALPLTSGGLNILRDQCLEEKVIRQVRELQQQSTDGTNSADEAAAATDQILDDEEALMPISVWRRRSSAAEAQQPQQADHQRQSDTNKKHSLGH